MIVVLAAALVACDGSTGPDSGISGTFDLTLVNGQALPMRYLVYGFGQSYRHAIDGTLTFRSSRRVIDTRHVTDQPQGNPVPFEIEVVDTTSFRVEDDMVIVDRRGIQGQLEAHSDTGFFDGEVLIMPVRTMEWEVPLRLTLTYVKR